MCSKGASLIMHLKKAPQNKKYLSKHSQNKILLLFLESKLKIKLQIKSKPFKIFLMIDESTDVSSKGQTVVVAGYIVFTYKSVQVKERFVEVLE